MKIRVGAAWIGAGLVVSSVAVAGPSISVPKPAPQVPAPTLQLPSVVSIGVDCFPDSRLHVRVLVKGGGNGTTGTVTVPKPDKSGNWSVPFNAAKNTTATIPWNITTACFPSPYYQVKVTGTSLSLSKWFKPQYVGFKEYEAGFENPAAKAPAPSLKPVSTAPSVTHATGHIYCGARTDLVVHVFGGAAGTRGTLAVPQGDGRSWSSPFGVPPGKTQPQLLRVPYGNCVTPRNFQVTVKGTQLDVTKNLKPWKLGYQETSGPI